MRLPDRQILELQVRGDLVRAVLEKIQRLLILLLLERDLAQPRVGEIHVVVLRIDVHQELIIRRGLIELAPGEQRVAYLTQNCRGQDIGLELRGDGQQVALLLGGLAAQFGEFRLGVEDARLRGRRAVGQRRAEQRVEFRAGIGRGRRFRDRRGRGGAGSAQARRSRRGRDGGGRLAR